MEIGQKILDTIYKHNKSAYGASSEYIEVVYDDDYDDLTDDLVELFSLHIVSYRRELFNAILDFTEELPLVTEDYSRTELWEKYKALNCS